ncbi:MAG: hypothetical protein E7458_09560 [Ruminococcaceae bacterium]|nr:hypothetical protein [Oscillospiraceae bacterium]
MSFDYFLGANTPLGFVPTFSDLTQRAEHLVIIKGGPGCGKSTAMRRIAEACESWGMPVERIRCSSDPASLDGVYLPALDTLYVDGTAPHVIEPSYPGAREQIWNLGECWDQGMLEARRGEIEALSREISRAYTAAYRFLRALGEVMEERRQQAMETADGEKLLRRAARIAESRIPHRRGAAEGRVIRIFLDALTPAGPLSLGDFSDWTVTELYDPEGLSGTVTGPVLSAARAAGYTVYAAHDPLLPHGAPLHLVIPELHWVLLTSGGLFGAAHTGARRIRLDLMKKDGVDTAPGRERELRELCRRLMELSSGSLGKAKRLHDELEALYRPAVDFRAVDRQVMGQIDRLKEAFTDKTRDSQWS